MPQVGIRELKNDTSEIIRAVREERAEYVVTLRGRPVAFIVPVDEGWAEAEAARGLQRRAQALESEAAALRADVRQVVQALDRVVATYDVEGEEYVITAGDVLAVREWLIKPHSEDAIHIVALADKVAQRQSQWPAEEQKRHFWETVEAIRVQAIADGTAIDDPLEAAIGD